MFFLCFKHIFIITAIVSLMGIYTYIHMLYKWQKNEMLNLSHAVTELVTIMHFLVLLRDYKHGHKILNYELIRVSTLFLFSIAENPFFRQQLIHK